MASSPHFLTLLAVTLILLVLPVSGQINTPCTASMLGSFTPCMNLLTNSTGSGTSPTADCCEALRSLMSNGTDCLCLLVGGNVPFRVPINRTVAMSLPRACSMQGVPLQCRASSAPIPAPGPTPFGPTTSPNSAASPSPTPPASNIPQPASPPEADGTQPLTPPESDDTQPLTPPSPPLLPDVPPIVPGNRPVLTPSAAKSSQTVSPTLLSVLLGAIALKYYYH